MTEQTQQSTSRTVAIVASVIVAVVVLAVVVVGFVLPSITGGANLVDVFNVIRGK